MAEVLQRISRLIRGAGAPTDDRRYVGAGPREITNEAIPATSEPAVSDTASSAEASSSPTFDPTIVATVAEKILQAWLRNRYQLLFPFSMDLRKLEPTQVVLFIKAMLAAIDAEGGTEQRERERISAALQRLDDSGDFRNCVEDAFARPEPLHELLRGVRDVREAALVYAASLTVLDARKIVNRRYLDYLAARLNLSSELISSLEPRFQPSV